MIATDSRRTFPNWPGCSNVELQIIFGLPGDSPEGFRRTLEYARSFSVGVRAYHCLVLPDALMTRGRPEWDIRFDPLNLNMISCRGWAAMTSRKCGAISRARRWPAAVRRENSGGSSPGPERRGRWAGRVDAHDRGELMAVGSKQDAAAAAWP